MDRLFWGFVRGLILLMVLFGAGMTIVILTNHSTIGLRMVGAFATMFAGLVGLGSGYLLGQKRNDNGSKKEEGGSHDSS